MPSHYRPERRDLQRVQTRAQNSGTAYCIGDEDRLDVADSAFYDWYGGETYACEDYDDDWQCYYDDSWGLLRLLRPRDCCGYWCDD